MVQRVANPRGCCANLFKTQFGLQAATRLHEVGIASNRGSARRGEYVPGLVHTARHTTEVGSTQSRLPNRKEGAS